MWKAIVSLSLFGSAAVLAGIIPDYGEHQLDESHHPHQQLQQHHQFQPLQHQQHQHQHQQQFEPLPVAHEPEPPAHTNHDHKVEHKHAISHQSFKIHHFHPVPVYVKKDKHPIEIGGVKHKLKQVHPETEKHHGYGLVLENHTDHKHHEVLGEEHHGHHGHGHGHDFQHDYHQPHHPLPAEPTAHHGEQPAEAAAAPHDAEQPQHDYQPGGDYASNDATSHYQFHDINTQHGHYQ